VITTVGAPHFPVERVWYNNAVSGEKLLRTPSDFEAIWFWSTAWAVRISTPRATRAVDFLPYRLAATFLNQQGFGVKSWRLGLLCFFV
jgi:hypothetical protein